MSKKLTLTLFFPIYIKWNFNSAVWFFTNYFQLQKQSYHQCVGGTG